MLTILKPYRGSSPFSLRRFGARPNVLTDQTDRVMSAIEAAEAEGGEVRCPAGTYYLEGNLPLPSDAILVTNATWTESSKTITKAGAFAKAYPYMTVLVTGTGITGWQYGIVQTAPDADHVTLFGVPTGLTDGATNVGVQNKPRMRPLVIRGEGPTWNTAEGSGGTWYWEFDNYGGTIFDFRGNDAPACIDTRGRGSLILENLTLYNGSGTYAQPFLQTTHTRLHVRDCCFKGHRQRLGSDGTANQDAIVPGGATSGTMIGSDATSPFQGYMFVVEHCLFQNLRRALYVRKFANAGRFTQNVIWATCGAGESAAAVEADTDDTISGLVIDNNCFESMWYYYCVKLAHTSNADILRNGFYDPQGANDNGGAFTHAFVRLEATAGHTRYVRGMVPLSLPEGVVEISNAGGVTNVAWAGQQLQGLQLIPPTSDPLVAGAVWNNAGTLAISAGA